MSLVRAMIPTAATGCLMAGTASAFLTGRKRSGAVPAQVGDGATEIRVPKYNPGRSGRHIVQEVQVRVFDGPAPVSIDGGTFYEPVLRPADDFQVAEGVKLSDCVVLKQSKRLDPTARNQLEQNYDDVKTYKPREEKRVVYRVLRRYWMLPVSGTNGDDSMVKCCRIGKGECGGVYQLANSEDDFEIKAGVMFSECVLKVQKGDKGVQMGEQEAAMHKKVGEHDNIATLHDSYPENGDHYMILKKYGKEIGEKKCVDLRGYAKVVAKKLRRESPAYKKFVYKVARQLVRGVKRMHENGVIHRDLKPANILVQCNGRNPLAFTLKIADFGIATDEENSETRCGSPNYMCPKMLVGQFGGPLSKCDMYSLGATLYKVAFRGYPYKVTKLEGMVWKRESKRDDQKEETYGPKFKALIDGLLNEMPGKRLGADEALEQANQLK